MNFLLAKQKTNQNLKDYVVSEKLDGMRFWWDGGVTRGQPAKNFSWYNSTKDDRDHIATGLWSRLGKVVYAPDWWLDLLPKDVCLDGEGFTGNFKSTISEARSFNGDWSNLRYYVFDFAPPQILIPNWPFAPQVARIFKENLALLPELANDVIVPVKQYPITEAAELLSTVLARGGEGIMYRYLYGSYIGKRSNWLLKEKGYLDSEVWVIIVVPGLGKHAGRMGSLYCTNGHYYVYVGTGFTDEEREATDWVGKTITIRYASLSANGVPREPRFLRIKE